MSWSPDQAIDERTAGRQVTIDGEQWYDASDDPEPQWPAIMPSRRS